MADIDPIDFGRKKKVKIEISDELDPTNMVFGPKKSRTKSKPIAEISDELDPTNMVFGPRKPRTKPKPIAEIAEISEIDEIAEIADIDYTYSELLTNVYKLLKIENKVYNEEKQKLKVPPCKVEKYGSNKTVFVNFIEYRKHNIKLEHFKRFIEAELSAKNTMINGDDQLVITGRYTQKTITEVVKLYTRTYMKCHSCTGFNTEIYKDGGLNMMRCFECLSSRSVAEISKMRLSKVKKQVD
jgi:translation initiation factor 2 beta subunit (eIF-2beta)/eIF-5